LCLPEFFKENRLDITYEFQGVLIPLLAICRMKRDAQLAPYNTPNSGMDLLKPCLLALKLRLPGHTQTPSLLSTPLGIF
jgi:hypothetical protein